MSKSDKLKLKIAQARQDAFVALQSGQYRDAARACVKAEKFQNKLLKLGRSAIRKLGKSFR